MEKSRAGEAVRRYLQGYNCGQAVVCTYCDLLGVDEKTGFRMSEAFGFGVAGMQGMCGGVSAMQILAGLAGSDGNLEKPGTKRAVYGTGRAMAESFAAKNTSMLCRDLRGDGHGKLRSCPGCVLDGARIVEKTLFPGAFEPYEGDEH